MLLSTGASCFLKVPGLLWPTHLHELSLSSSKRPVQTWVLALRRWEIRWWKAQQPCPLRALLIFRPATRLPSKDILRLGVSPFYVLHRKCGTHKCTMTLKAGHNNYWYHFPCRLPLGNLKACIWSRFKHLYLHLSTSSRAWCHLRLQL